VTGCVCVSDIRTEAVMQALALNKRQSFMPMPSKRASSAAVAASHHKPAASTEQHGSGGLVSQLVSFS